MVIDNSNISMNSTHKSYSYSSSKSITLEERSLQAIKLDLTKGADGLFDQVENHVKDKQEKQKQQEKENEKQQAFAMRDMLRKQTQEAKVIDYSSQPEDFKLSLLKLMLRALNKKVHGDDVDSYKSFMKNDTKGFSLSSNSMSAKQKDMALVQKYFPVVSQAISGTPVQMTRTTVQSSFTSYVENTAFEGTGIVNTTDGRSIEFGITLEMSQSFTKQYESFSQQSYFFMDPLTINLDSNVTHISDQKFLFDLDSDGKKEEISFAEKGSGFLALDKNDDGVINDGSELFGTKSGDGFADLAKYDSDHNGWIDEADEIYKKLKIWTKDDDGKDQLIGLKQADVGAIYLGNASTEFSLYDEANNNKNGQIKKTGIYLKESGGAGTVQHVDLAI